MNLTQVRKSSDIVFLCKLFDNCQTETRNLWTLEIKEGKHGALLCLILIKLLLFDIVLEITKKYVNDDEWKVSEITGILKSEVVSREKTTALISNPNAYNTEYVTPAYSKHDHYDLSNKSNKNCPATTFGLLNEYSNRWILWGFLWKR